MQAAELQSRTFRFLPVSGPENVGANEPGASEVDSGAAEIDS